MRLDYIKIAGLALLFFTPFLGEVHLFDWDEINIAECTREMLATGDYLRPQIDFQPFWEKPPLFMWFQALSMHIFGVNEFAARFPNVICGLATMLTVYYLGRRLHDRVFGWLWALGWLGSILPHLFFRSGVADPWFNLLIFAGLFGFIEFRWQFFATHQRLGFWQRYRYLLLGGWLLGLAIITNGPVAYLVVFLTLMVYWGRYKFKNRGFARHLALFSLAAFSIPVLWFGLEIALNGPSFLAEFLAYQTRVLFDQGFGHGGFFGYYALVLLVGGFPVSVFALPNLWGDHTSEDELLESDTLASCKRSDLGTWMQILFWVVLVLFSFTKAGVTHYASLAYFPLTYLGAATLWRAFHWVQRPAVVGPALLVLGLAIGFSKAFLPYFGKNIQWLEHWFAHDPFMLAKMEADVPWQWWHGLPGVVLIAATLGAWHFWHRQQPWKSAQTVFAGGAIFIAFTLLLNIRNLEAYLQCPVIEFYESKAGEDCSIQPIGFSSYAHLFYSKKRPEALAGVRLNAPDAPTPAGKKVYFVVNVNHLHEFPVRPACRELYRKNGYVFLEMQPK